MRARLTSKQADVCRSLRWGMEHFNGLCSSSVHPTWELRAAEKRGLACCHGYHPMCDDDGFTKEPEVMRLMFTITPFGELMLAREEALLSGDVGIRIPIYEALQ